MGWGEQLKLSEKDGQTAQLQQALGELREQKTAEAAAAAAGEEDPMPGVTTAAMLAALKEAAAGGDGSEDALSEMFTGSAAVQPATSE